MLFNLIRYTISIKLFFGSNDQLIQLIKKFLKQKKSVLILGNPRFGAYKSCEGVNHVISQEAVSRAIDNYTFGTSTYDVIINFTSRNPVAATHSSISTKRTTLIKYEYKEKLLKLLPILELRSGKFLDINNFYV